MNAPRNTPDIQHRYGAFANIGPEAEISVYFETAVEAVAYARGYWAALSDEARKTTDVYAGEINIREINGRLAWDKVSISYDAKEEASA